MACLVVFLVNLTPCNNDGASPHLAQIVGGALRVAVFALATWTILAAHWRRPWLLIAGVIAATPALWFAAASFGPNHVCP